MTLAQMSLRGGAVIAAALLLRTLLLDRLPKRTFVALWGVAVLTLLLPWTLPSPVSLWGLLPDGKTDIEESAAINAPQEAPGAHADRQSGTFEPPAMSEAPHPGLRVLRRAGSGLLLSFFLAAWLRLRLRYARARAVDNAPARACIDSAGLLRRVRMRESEAVSSPLTYGVLRPVILFPQGTQWERSEELELIVAHEVQHIRCFDAAKKALLILALVLHWFNPLVWLMFIVANWDIELACDEAVLRRLGLEKRRAYALTLLEMEENRSILNAAMSGMARSAVKQRVRSIMKMKKTSILRGVIALALVVGVCAVFAPAAADKSGSAPETEMTQEPVNKLTEEEPSRLAGELAEIPEECEAFETAFQVQRGRSEFSSGNFTPGKISSYYVGGGNSVCDMMVAGLNKGTELTARLTGSHSGTIRVVLVDYWTGKTAAETDRVETSGDVELEFKLTAPYTGYFHVMYRTTDNCISSWLESECAAEAAIQPPGREIE